MGKVLSSFLNGSSGAVSRSVDDIVIALPNREASSSIAFGAPVFLSSDKTGAVNVTADSESTDFIGFAVRSASKTPDTYGSNAGSYAPGEMMDILTRGTVVAKVDAQGAPAKGTAVHVIPATGRLTGVSTDNIALPNCYFRGPMDRMACAEVVLTKRNIL